MFIKTILTAATAAVALTGVAMAQNAMAEPNYGTVNLSVGFTPDPYMVQVTVGGTIDASSLGNGCAGMISNAPDVRLNFDGNGGGLWIGAVSNGDTTIVVNAPNGQWFCNDDYSGLDPAVGGAGAGSGQYDIWVGHLSGDALATLFITEIEP